MSYHNIREEELKNKIAADFFGKFDSTKIIGNIDFCITFREEISQTPLFETQSLLWAEAKQGKSDIYKSLVQLILTIGKARTFDKVLPPAFLGAFDANQIAFIPYNTVHNIFGQNDFNWNVTPSNHETREFKQILETVKTTIDTNSLLFQFASDTKEIHAFIKDNFIAGKSELSKIRIDKNNFISIYTKWLVTVKPSIIAPWENAKKAGIIDGDFYLADLLSDNNQSLKESLYVILKDNHYEFDKKLDDIGFFSNKTSNFNDNQKAHQQFWNKYDRPPKEEYWDYILERRDLLVSQDVRERKGSFFTPQIWVEKSQEYLMDVLGVDWQDEYYIWDCAAGTGNLLAGLTNKYNIYASTLDQADVDVMKDRIKNGTNLLESHVFQFDFLNDNFNDQKVPKPLQDIINDPEKRKKLVIYINPPYAEVSSKAIKGKIGVNLTNIHKKYTGVLGTAGRELYTQFMTRIYAEIIGCVLAEFSKQKVLQGSAFDVFRGFFQAKLVKCFVVPADTFDNVKGKFPIGFKIWDTSIKDKFLKITSDVYNSNGIFECEKLFWMTEKSQFINKWISIYKTYEKDSIGYMDGINGNDFQHNNIVYILNKKEQLPNPRGIWIRKENLIPISIYNTVRKIILATWLNDRDQFLFPNKGWENDLEFQNDCMTYSLFSNNIQSKFGINNWIPFTENEVNARDKFASNFMTQFIGGKLGEPSVLDEASLVDDERGKELFDDVTPSFVPNIPLVFSVEAKQVFDMGRELWRYYHNQPNSNVNASLYDIREHFQGRNPAGKMNNKSQDKKYTQLIANLRDSLKVLGAKIQPKVYEYGFLKG